MVYNPNNPQDSEFFLLAPALIRQNFEGLRLDRIVDAGYLRGYIPGNAQGNIPISNGNLCVGLNAEKLNGKTYTNFALASHNHNASSITSGLLSADRIPNLNMSKITAGNLDATRVVEPNYVRGSITDMAKPLFDVLRADRTAFLPADQIIIEKSTDGGVTWEDAEVTDNAKRQLFTGQRPSTIKLPLKDGIRNTDCMLRITITAMKYNVPAGTPETEKYNYWNSDYILSTERYTSFEEMWIWLSSLSDRIYCKVERAKGNDPNTWVIDGEGFMSGWAGGNYIRLSGSTFGGAKTQTANYWNWRFTFRTATTNDDFDNSKLTTTYTNQNQYIAHIKTSGKSAHTLPNNLMYHDHLYKWDIDQNAIFPAEVKATTFRNTDGAEVSYSGHQHTTDQIAEGNNLYFTQERVNALITKEKIESELTGEIGTHYHNISGLKRGLELVKYGADDVRVVPGMLHIESAGGNYLVRQTSEISLPTNLIGWQYVTINKEGLIQYHAATGATNQRPTDWPAYNYLKQSYYWSDAERLIGAFYRVSADTWYLIQSGAEGEESGVNAGGSWSIDKYGNMKCWGNSTFNVTCNIAWGALYRSAKMNWLYPVRFIERPSFSVDVQMAPNFICTTGTLEINSEMAAFYVIKANEDSAVRSTTMGFVATGKFR